MSLLLYALLTEKKPPEEATVPTRRKVLLIGDITEEQFEPIRRKLRLRRGRGIVRLTTEQVYEAQAMRQAHLEQVGMFTQTQHDYREADIKFDEAMRHHYESLMGCSFADLVAFVIDGQLRNLGVDFNFSLPDQYVDVGTRGYSLSTSPT